MTTGFVGMMGSSAVIKKLGGYANTKLHGVIALGGLVAALGGLVCIYHNKTLMRKSHFTSVHAISGLICFVGCVGVGAAGALLLHPDFGVAKSNRSFRKAHKFAARFFVALAWLTCVSGLSKVASSTTTLVMYTTPLILLAPFTLM